MVTLFRISHALLCAMLLLMPFGAAQAQQAEEGKAPGPLLFVDAEELHCLALNFYWEARGEGRNGMEAVAHVTLNRMRDEQFPGSICEVVQQGGSDGPCQFSWWCDGRSDTPFEEEVWKRARYISWAVMTGRAPLDHTDGALFYHHEDIEPTWVARLEKTAKIGQHLFYKH